MDVVIKKNCALPKRRGMVYKFCPLPHPLNVFDDKIKYSFYSTCERFGVVSTSSLEVETKHSDSASVFPPECIKGNNQILGGGGGEGGLRQLRKMLGEGLAMD